MPCLIVGLDPHKFKQMLNVAQCPRLHQDLWTCRCQLWCSEASNVVHNRVKHKVGASIQAWHTLEVEQNLKNSPRSCRVHRCWHGGPFSDWQNVWGTDFFEWEPQWWVSWPIDRIECWLQIEVPHVLWGIVIHSEAWRAVVASGSNLLSICRL